MPSLSSPLRKQLESCIKTARKTAEAGAQKALEALAVHEADPYRHMDDAQRTLRRKLRAQARQLGDVESQIRPGTYSIHHLAEKVAYDQWHRLLFARFLLENGLLISPEHEVSVTLTDCEELAPSLGLKDAWSVAGRFTATVLPEAFRVDDPAAAVDLPIEERNQLLRLLTGLPIDVFTASDSLGWTYQFWQAERKVEVNASGSKIGADELSPVTQLFTEDYMVDFLLDNTLGAWHAGKVLAANPKLAETAQSEDELRQAVALPGCPWSYLRFIKGKDSQWTPAAGTFDGWPKSAAAFRALDPCMGSGHFVVAMFERLVALRLAEEKLDEAAAVAAVIRDNLFGLEIDPRCTQIGAFNLALAAWRRVGHCKLPAMNLACSGLAPNAKREDWLKLTEGAPHLRFQMGALYNLFEKAPVLGSLINPRADKAVTYGEAFHELQPLMEKALERETKDETAHEMAVTARGLAKAAEILAGQFTLVATNVPFLGYREMGDELLEHVSTVFADEKGDLGYCLWRRFHSFVAQGTTTALVTLQHWLSLRSYLELRKHLLTRFELSTIAHLGTGAFETISGEKVNVTLTIATKSYDPMSASICLVDAAKCVDLPEKAVYLRDGPINVTAQNKQYANPDHRISFGAMTDLPNLSEYADCLAGIMNGDSPKFIRNFWEIPQKTDLWTFLQSTVSEGTQIGGLESVILFDEAKGHLREEAAIRRVKLHNADERGNSVWGRPGVAISQMSSLPASRYFGDKYDSNVASVVPRRREHLAAIWSFCSSESFYDVVRAIDRKLNVTNATFGKVPFDLAHWQQVAAEKYPHGLPKPFSSDPTQWLFIGHPAGADQPLHVAVARLLGYQWPRQTGSRFPDCPALGPDGLEKLADDDGIVCLSATKGEPPAAERLRTLLAQALGSYDLKQLLATAGAKGSKSETLDEWLRDEFFDHHCALFHHRPFVWHIWDGLKNGFSALVNYHKLTHAQLEKLTFAYLGDWIRRQQNAVDAGEAGSDAKLQAARELQAKLKLILDGEAPYDLFVRWKPLSQQPIGWNPDLNDGVRMNIRPFAEADVLRKKVKIKWEKDRGAEPQRDKAEFPWFWSGSTFTGNRVNDVHLTREQKQRASTR